MAEIIHLNEDSFDTAVATKDRPVVVDFWAPWCGPCRTIAPILDELADELGDAVQITKVNVEDNQGLAQKFGVRAIPTLLIFKGGEVQTVIQGIEPKESIAEKIKALN